MALQDMRMNLLENPRALKIEFCCKIGDVHFPGLPIGFIMDVLLIYTKRGWLTRFGKTF